MNKLSMSSITVIEPGRQELNYWRDLWRYRELFYVLAWRDLAVRYKQTVIGAAWAVIRPISHHGDLYRRLRPHRQAALRRRHAPYPLMVFAGMLPWTFFSTALSDASGSLIGNANLISKVYFPRLIVPSATVVVAFVDFLISFTILVGMMVWYPVSARLAARSAPAVCPAGHIASLGPACWMTALNVKYRDFRYVIPFVVQLGLYVSPVGFSSKVVPEQWRLLYSLNPMVGVIDGFRWCLLGGQSELYLPGIMASIVVAAFFLWFGIRRFRKTEASFADLI